MFDWKRALAHRILDRCVLRPSRHELDAEDLIRFAIPHHALTGSEVSETSEFTEAYVFTNSARLIGIHRDAASVASHTTTPIPIDALGESPRHLVIKFPGTGGRAERSSEAPLHWIYPEVNQSSVPHGQHVEVWTWNPPGYGRSTPAARLAHQAPYAEDFARQIATHRCGTNTTVWLAGNSLGCVTVLSLAARLSHWCPVLAESQRVGLWCRNPPDLEQVILRIADRYRARRWMQRVVQHLPDDADVMASAAACSIPAVFLASELDSLVPSELQADLHQAYAGPKQAVLLEGLDHDGLLEEQHVPDVQSAAHWLFNCTGRRYGT